ncbi:hypothetical protein UVI_02052010 [Ustilaginoidea virens]|uniref:F-box domain-containing protein n=1 Tax=Ustilaginoidea virens TaxID=1159556 RepID=A0A1B5L1Z0_USTVR|nr:hypothetical protein UVI_02052010 [Ustilaginoidea virens]
MPRHIGRARVDEFLATLSPQDLLYLRRRLGTIPRLAGLAHLPAEITSMIALQLSLDDFVHCRLVCRSWLASWTQDAVITAICHHFFPGMLEKHGDSTPRQLLQSALARHLRRARSQPSQFFLPWDRRVRSPVFGGREPAPNDDIGISSARVAYRPPGPPVFYDGGRLAWQLDSVTVVVDDLRTCRRRFCRFSAALIAGERMSLQGMSRSLLVFAATKDTSQPLPRACKVTVVRYEHDQPTKQWQEAIHEASMAQPPAEHALPSRATPLCPEISPYGLYSLGTLLAADGNLDPPHVVEFAAVAFSIYKESFVQRECGAQDHRGGNARREFWLDPTTWGLGHREEDMAPWARDAVTAPRFVWLDGGMETPDGAALVGEVGAGVGVSEPCRVFGDEDFQLLVTGRGILVRAYARTALLAPRMRELAAAQAAVEKTALVDAVRPVDLKPLGGTRL